MTHRRRDAIRRALLRWFARERRDLPWRTTDDLYHILVSEIMLQQTQVDRVVPKYTAFLTRWPTVQHLARAKRASVIRQWSGLGYNRRAVNLHRAAQVIVADYDGVLPSDAKTLDQLPGVGPYTARAVATFARNVRQSFVDTNVRRVLGRVALGKHFATIRDDPAVHRVAEVLTPPRRARDWHGALMDLGATVCKSKPACPVCPLRHVCRSYPAIVQTPRRRTKTPQPSFADSDRYWRGRIIAVFSEETRRRLLTLREIVTVLPQPLALPRLKRLVGDLQRDGLVTKNGQRYRLA